MKHCFASLKKLYTSTFGFCLIFLTLQFSKTTGSNAHDSYDSPQFATYLLRPGIQKNLLQIQYVQWVSSRVDNSPGFELSNSHIFISPKLAQKRVTYTEIIPRKIEKGEIFIQFIRKHQHSIVSIKADGFPNLYITLYRNGETKVLNYKQNFVIECRKGDIFELYPSTLGIKKYLKKNRSYEDVRELHHQFLTLLKDKKCILQYLAWEISSHNNDIDPTQIDDNAIQLQINSSLWHYQYFPFWKDPLIEFGEQIDPKVLRFAFPSFENDTRSFTAIIQNAHYGAIIAHDRIKFSQAFRTPANIKIVEDQVGKYPFELILNGDTLSYFSKNNTPLEVTINRMGKWKDLESGVKHNVQHGDLILITIPTKEKIGFFRSIVPCSIEQAAMNLEYYKALTLSIIRVSETSKNLFNELYSNYGVSEFHGNIETQDWTGSLPKEQEGFDGKCAINEEPLLLNNQASSCNNPPLHNSSTKEKGFFSLNSLMESLETEFKKLGRYSSAKPESIIQITSDNESEITREIGSAFNNPKKTRRQTKK